MAIMAKVVIDATGDGDVFARTGAAFDTDIELADAHHCMNTAWLFAGVDMNRWIAFKAGQPEAFTPFIQRGREACKLFERPYVSWRNDVAMFLGPRRPAIRRSMSTISPRSKSSRAAAWTST